MKKNFEMTINYIVKNYWRSTKLSPVEKAMKNVQNARKLEHVFHEFLLIRTKNRYDDTRVVLNYSKIT